MNILIVGVGGQGTLLASRILGSAAADMGYDVKVSEVHGMSQRGGSVVTYVRWGESVSSPIIERGEADYILAFEQLEAARYLPFLREGGRIIMNTQKMAPVPVLIGAAQYPEGIPEAITAAGAALTQADALGLAVEAGSDKAVNLVLIGALASTHGYERAIWESAIKKCVPERWLEVNMRAFDAGLAL